ncbi:hypothetical protein [Chryseobacterium sp.]|uniref:hypothetical protein n=1 Tax=Chryseobacterium sp. TaxID=1871047 RepID=UPI00289B3073|nr:hypothetical protein [Chryseobacterium sp.]
MSKQSIAEKSLIIRNETELEGNSKERIANLVDDINETKLDVDGDIVVKKITAKNLSNAEGDATFTKQLVIKENGEFGFQSKSVKKDTKYEIHLNLNPNAWKGEPLIVTSNWSEETLDVAGYYTRSKYYAQGTTGDAGINCVQGGMSFIKIKSDIHIFLKLRFDNPNYAYELKVDLNDILFKNYGASRDSCSLQMILLNENLPDIKIPVMLINNKLFIEKSTIASLPNNIYNTDFATTVIIRTPYLELYKN